MLSRKEKLNVIALQHNAVITNIIKKTQIIKQERVEFSCFCGKRHSKQINDVCGKKSTGLFCYEHSLENKRRQKIRNILKESSIKHRATFSENDIEWGKKSCVTFQCFCGIKNTKTFSGITKNQGMFCKEHTKQNTREKSKNTSILNYGTEHPQQSNIIKDNIKQTCFKKYGVEYLAHVSEIHDKQHKYRFKNYIMPSGTICKIQGYEDLALDEILKEYTEESISTKRFGIKYTFNNEIHYYYPDILLNNNKIIEVKSEHTMYHHYYYDKNLSKRETCVTNGYEFEFWIYDKKGNKHII